MVKPLTNKMASRMRRQSKYSTTCLEGVGSFVLRVIDAYIALDRSFLVANAQHADCSIIYCSDGFCRLSGFSRAEVMQKPAICEFLHGPLTSQHAVTVVKDALAAGVEKHLEILYYKKDGIKFLCSEVIAPVKSEVDDICLYILNFEDMTAPAVVPEEQISDVNHKLSRFDRGLQSFRQSFRMGSLRRSRGRGRLLAGYPSSTLTPPSDVTAERTDSDEEDNRKNEGCEDLEESKRRLLYEEGRPRGEGGKDRGRIYPAISSVVTTTATTTVAGSTTTATTTTANRMSPIASPEIVSRGPALWDTGQGSMPGAASQMRSATSLDAISRQRLSDALPSIPSRSATVCALSTRDPEMNFEEYRIRPHTLDNFSEAARNHVSKSFPNASSESDLARYRTSIWDRRDRKSPSLSNIASDSYRHKFSIQDNGSAKFFQGALHTPKMGEKVAQVS